MVTGKAVRHKKSDIRALELATVLVEHKARGGMVEYLTSVSKTMVQEIYARVHNERPPGGRLPADIQGWFARSRELRVPVLTFIQIYYAEMGDEMYCNIDVESFVRAYEAYLAMSADAPHRISISHAFVVAREILNGVQMSLEKCSECGSLHFAHKESETCWICEQIPVARHGSHKHQRQFDLYPAV